jgi:hypothetical protein
MGFGCCIGQIAILIFGIIALIKGEFQLSADRVVRSGPARVVGALLLLSLVLGPGGALLYGFAVGVSRGVELAKQGKQAPNEADKAALKAEIETPANIINIGGTLLPLVAAFIVAFATAGPRRRPVRDDIDDDDDDDRPRRRRPRDEDEDDEDDRPRRRRRDDDDEADEHIKER